MFFKKVDYRHEYSKLGLALSPITIRPYGQRAGVISRLIQSEPIACAKLTLNRKFDQGTVWKFYRFQKELPSGLASLYKSEKEWDWHLESDNKTPEFRKLFDDSIVKICHNGYFEFEATENDISLISDTLSSGGVSVVKYISMAMKTFADF